MGFQPRRGAANFTALQEKADFALADAVTGLLVRRKQISVGKAYFEDALIARPHLPAEITDKIRRFVREDVRERVLTQEIIIAFGLLVRAEPRLFDNLIAVQTPDLRIHDFITLDILIGHAVRQCWLETHPDRENAYDEDKPAA